MRLTGIVFFILLAAQVGLRLFRPTPAPDWYRPCVVATAAGIILCLAVTAALEWRHRSGKGKASGPTGPAKSPNAAGRAD